MKTFATLAFSAAAAAAAAATLTVFDSSAPAARKPAWAVHDAGPVPLSSPALVAITGGEYSVDGKPFTPVAGIVWPGSRLRVRALVPPGEAARVSWRVGAAGSAVTLTHPATPAR